MESPPQAATVNEPMPIADAPVTQPLPIADNTSEAEPATSSRACAKRKHSSLCLSEVTHEPTRVFPAAPAAPPGSSPVQSPPPCRPPYPQQHGLCETDIPRRGKRYLQKTTHPVSMGGPPCDVREHEQSQDTFLTSTNSCGSGDTTQPGVTITTQANVEVFASTRRKRRSSQTGPPAQRKMTAKDTPLLAAVERLREARANPIG